MSDIPEPAEEHDVRPPEGTDWDSIYRMGTPPWDIGKPSAELVRVLSEGLVPRGTALDMGCGTGADAIYLAKRRFDVTAIDLSPMAIERARVRLEREGGLVRFVQGDICRFAHTAGQFDFIYDAGLYHCMRETDLNDFLDVLWRVTRPGSMYLSLCGAKGEKAEGGPPQVSEDDIHDELGRLFEFIHVRPFRFESPRRPEGYAGWSCLMRRPTPVKPAK